MSKIVLGSRVKARKLGREGKVTHTYTDTVGTAMAYVRLDGESKAYPFQITALDLVA